MPRPVGARRGAGTLTCSRRELDSRLGRGIPITAAAVTPLKNDVAGSRSCSARQSVSTVGAAWEGMRTPRYGRARSAPSIRPRPSPADAPCRVLNGAVPRSRGMGIRGGMTTGCRYGMSRVIRCPQARVPHAFVGRVTGEKCTLRWRWRVFFLPLTPRVSQAVPRRAACRDTGGRLPSRRASRPGGAPVTGDNNTVARAERVSFLPVTLISAGGWPQTWPQTRAQRRLRKRDGVSRPIPRSSRPSIRSRNERGIVRSRADHTATPPIPPVPPVPPVPQLCTQRNRRLHWSVVVEICHHFVCPFRAKPSVYNVRMMTIRLRRAVAQLVEQRSPKPQVAGSSPVRPAARFVHLCGSAISGR